jgi:hypothetical protein
MPQHRRRLLMEDNDTSFFNVVPTSQFNIPSWGETQGALYGVQMNNDKTKVLMMQNGDDTTTPNFQKRISIYENSNPNGIIESASDLTYIDQTEEFNFEVGGLRQSLQSGFLYNEDLGKIWVVTAGDETIIVGEWNFNIDTNTQSFVQYVTLPYGFKQGSFYFSGDGTSFYTSKHGGSGVTIVRYDLSISFDLSTYSVSQTREWDSYDGLTFASPPFFYSNGGYGIYLSYYSWDGANINKRQFSTPFDFTSVELGTGYHQAIERNAYNSQIRLSAQLPIFFSKDLRKMNYFSINSSAGGAIGVGYFDIPINFRGLGDELGGVRLLPSTVIPF